MTTIMCLIFVLGSAFAPSADLFEGGRSDIGVTPGVPEYEHPVSTAARRPPSESDSVFAMLDVYWLSGGCKDGRSCKKYERGYFA